VDFDDLAGVRAAMTPATRLIWAETPSNPQLRIADIAALAGIAHEAGALLACDNTFATPVLQQPLALGADVVMHSTTKYFGGHSDVMGGALVFARRDELYERVAHRRHITGNILAPFSAWLTLRGCRSLPARMAWHCRNARIVAEFLAAQPQVARVHWPGLDGHPNHAVAAAQMRDFGAMLSFRMKGGRDAALALAGGLKLILNATSLGGCESLIEHRASVEGAHPVTPQDLLRLSVGLEHPDDLLEDLRQAMP
jgi:cystathionine gamma-synthase